MVRKNTKTLTIIAALLVILSSAALIGAYFTGTDESTNTFVVGSVEIGMEEPSWNLENARTLSPGQIIPKDPLIMNTCENKAYVFMKVSVPKKLIYTYNPNTLARNEKAVTQLFQLNKGNNKPYTGNDTVNDGWTLVESITSEEETNDYIYAYGSSSALTALEVNQRTPKLFDTVTYCYAVEGQDLDVEEKLIDVEAYGIQTENLTDNDKKNPSAVWSIIEKQKNL